MRESAAIPIAEQLVKKGAALSYYDPYISKFEINLRNSKTPLSVPRLKQLSKETISDFDLCLILADHSGIDYDSIAKWAPTVVDSRNAIKGKAYKNVYRL